MHDTQFLELLRIYVKHVTKIMQASMADMRHSMEALSADKKILEERLAKEKVCAIISGACTIILYSKVKQI